MPRFALTIEYDGAPYVGWQRQANGVSVQQRLEEAVAAINGGARAVVHGAGRTDAGVHALGQLRISILRAIGGSIGCATRSMRI